MNCKNCGEINLQGSKFCIKCVKPLETIEEQQIISNNNTIETKETNGFRNNKKLQIIKLAVATSRNLN